MNVITLIINNVFEIIFGSSKIYILSSCIYGIRIRTCVPNTDIPVIYYIKRFNKNLKSQ